MTGQNDRQDRSLTGQARDQAGHCPLTGRYLPCTIIICPVLLLFRNYYKYCYYNYYFYHYYYFIIIIIMIIII